MNKVELMLLGIVMDELSGITEKISALLEGEGNFTVEFEEAEPATDMGDEVPDTLDFKHFETLSAPVRARVPEEKQEKRIDSDEMSDPPISSDIAADIAGYVKQVESRLNGQPLNCIVLGKYTGQLAVAISDTFGGAGGRVLCIGDCLDSDNRPLLDWSKVVGGRFKQTVFPVAGDIDETFQDTEKPIDMVLFSTCGSYTESATLISRWSGLVHSGGMVCGTQFDKEHYRASHDAVIDVFGENRVEKSEITTCWNVKIGSKDKKP